MNFFCTHCGVKVTPSTRYCTKCGAPLQMIPQVQPSPAFSPSSYQSPARSLRKRKFRLFPSLMIAVVACLGVALLLWDNIYSWFGPQPLALYTPAHLNIDTIAWSPDEHYIAVATHDSETNHDPQPIVQVFATHDGKLISTYTAHSSPIDALAWSPDGKRIASGAGTISSFKKDNSVRIWDPLTGRHILTHSDYFPYGSDDYRAIAWSPDGKRIASAGKDFTVQIWNAATGNSLITYACGCGGANGVVMITWSPDGTRIASTDLADQFNIWDAASGTRVFSSSLHDALAQVTAVTWSPDGRSIAFGYRPGNTGNSSDFALQVFDGATMGKQLSLATNIGPGHISNMTWLPDGKQLIFLRKAAQGSGRFIETWKLSENGLKRTCQHDLAPEAMTGRGRSRQGTVGALAFSQDRTQIAFGGGYRGGLEIWPTGCLP